MQEEYRDILVIGAGPAGLFAVFEAGIFGMTTCIIDASKKLGGQCMTFYPNKPIYDIPSQLKITGKELALSLKEQADRFSPLYKTEVKISKIECPTSYEKPFQSTLSDGSIVHSKAIILATGSGISCPRRPPLDNLDLFEEISVFYNANSLDKFHNKIVAIAGGGDSALDWTIFLAENTAKKVYLIHRRSSFRGNVSSIKEIEKLSNKGLVEVVAPAQLLALKGKNGILEKIIISSKEKNNKELLVQKLVLCFGMEQSTEDLTRLNLDLKMSMGKVIINPATAETSVAGIYAIGDIATHENKANLILTGFSEAAAAAKKIRESSYFNKNDSFTFKYSTSWESIS